MPRTRRYIFNTLTVVSVLLFVMLIFAYSGTMHGEKVIDFASFQIWTGAQFVDFHIGPDLKGLPDSRFEWVVLEYSVRSQKGIGTLRVVSIHYLVALPSLLVCPLLWLALRWRNRRRLAKVGTCPTCGYDLTGNESGECPECGVGIIAT